MKKIYGIIPAAGLGTRFLPLTKSIPKEMLPLGSKPAIEYVIQEGIDAGIHDWVIITSERKSALRHYLEHDITFETTICPENKKKQLRDINTLIDASSLIFVNQKSARGLGDAILHAKDYVCDNLCAILLPDDIMVGVSSTKQTAIGQLIDHALQLKSTVIGIKRVALEDIVHYGSIAIKRDCGNGLFQVSHVVEKPQPEDAPSLYAVVGRYVVVPEVFTILENLDPAVNGEIQFTDALSELIRQGHPVYAYIMEGDRYDVGTVSGWKQAVNALVP